MNDQQQKWFEELYNTRYLTATTLMNNFAVRNIWKSVVEKYSDQAHFIYELLQNADDTKAKKSSFKLTAEGLYFKHDGEKHFWVTNPETEEEDQEKNQLGDINAITAVAQSNKKNHSTIGKFGVGFKAVFQYTESPHIYDPHFRFRIDRFIVPVGLNNDLANRKPNETLFYFPFDKKEMPPENAYSDILDKLKKLVYPTLFLTNLEEVSWETENENGSYRKEVTEATEYENLIVEKIEIIKEEGLIKSKERVILFTRFIKNQKHCYSIGFFLDEGSQKLIPKLMPAFCFFPTKEVTNLNFILHAPFLLTDSREGIKKGQTDGWNEDLISKLAQLSADSLVFLRDLKLIDDDIFKIIPYKQPTEFFLPFYETIKEKFANEELLPTSQNTYVGKADAYWAQDSPVQTLFSDQQLAYLIGVDHANWIFKNFVRNQAGKDEDLRDYIDACTDDCWYDMNEMLRFIDGEFIEKQTNAWLFKFYEYLSKNNSYWVEVKTKPIFLNQDRQSVSAYNEKNKLILYFPDNDGDGYESLHIKLFSETGEILSEAEKQKGKQINELFEDKILLARQFYEKFGIREHTVADEIEEAIDKFQKQELIAESFFAKAFKYFKNECPQDEIDNFIDRIKTLAFIPFNCKNETFGTMRGIELFYPTEKLIEFYKESANIQFVDIKGLRKKYSHTDYKSLDYFLEKLGVNDKEPELRDEVFNIILPQYIANGKPNNNTVEEGVKHLNALLRYYKECPQNLIVEYINKLETIQFLLYHTTKEPQKLFWGKAKMLYYPSKELYNYFTYKQDTRFIYIEAYQKDLTEQDRLILKELLMKIGIKELPRIIESEIIDWNIKNTIKSKYGDSLKSGTYGYHGQGTFDKVIDGCSEILNNINKEISEVLWNTLSLLSKAHENLRQDLTGKHRYFYYSQQLQYFEATILTRLKTSKWLLSVANEFVAPCEISVNELATDYPRNKELEELLDFKSPLPLLSEKEIFINSLSDEEFLKLKKWKEIEDEKKQSLLEQPSFKDIDGGLDWLEKVKKTYSPKPKTEKNNQDDTDDQQNSSHPLIDFDEDQEFEKGIDNLKKQIEIKKLRSELIQKIEGLKRYSYDWFESFLKLLNTYVEKQTTTQQKTVSFQEIRHYKTDNKYFLLKGANTYVSSEIEDASDIKLKLIFKNRDYEPIIVEGVSKKGQDLLVYCPNAISQPLINRFADVARIEIQFTPAIDLLERLYKAFINRNYIYEWIDIQDAMPPLNYIYGPPGTGKTTTLCNKINHILQEDPNAKFLILTPTNKAADVICNKLLLTNAGIKTVRLGKATDPDLEGKNIYRDSLYNNDLTSIDVVASTIHRLPYFEINDYGLLFQYQWDYVIFDESSMAGLHYIVFAIMALYKTNSDAEFIVAGDPKQIPPVIEVTDKELESFDFQDENIYKMMGLVSFDPSQQKIRVYTDSIINLDNQYRSLPQIGHLFSELSYSKLLKHDREINRSKSKPLPEKFRKIISENVSFINIPLNQDNSIYKVKKLIYSSYHTYCAILVAEIIKFFDQSNDGERDWTIGLIAPYKAQAILLNKLITSYGISEYVKVISDTVHGFQGDECDIVFFVCNPNNYYYTGHSKCLLSKEYIYNVAISRAMDYLVILHPFTVIDKNVYINKIAFSHNEYSGHFHFKSSSEIEKQLLGDERFIENNAFTTGHDNVNVFGLSDMKYFIKANETAIDIQIRDLKEIAKAKPIKHDNYIPIETPPVEGVKIIGKIDLSQFDKYKKHKNH